MNQLYPDSSRYVDQARADRDAPVTVSRVKLNKHVSIKLAIPSTHSNQLIIGAVSPDKDGAFNTKESRQEETLTRTMNLTAPNLRPGIFRSGSALRRNA